MQAWSIILHCTNRWQATGSCRHLNADWQYRRKCEPDPWAWHPDSQHGQRFRQNFQLGRCKARAGAARFLDAHRQETVLSERCSWCGVRQYCLLEKKIPAPDEHQHQACTEQLEIIWVQLQESLKATHKY
jgi:hypothetical protein